MAWGRWRQVTVSRPPRPLLPAGTRRAAAVVIAVCVAVVAALAIRYAGHTQAGPFDASRILLFAGELFAASTLVMALAWLAVVKAGLSVGKAAAAPVQGLSRFLPFLSR